MVLVVLVPSVVLSLLTMFDFDEDRGELVLGDRSSDSRDRSSDLLFDERPRRRSLVEEEPELFFEPERYQAWADRWHADHRPSEVRGKKTHVLFEARGKTELSSAFELMKALASDSENYRVTYLSPGGLWVHRVDKDGTMKNFILKPGEEKKATDVVEYEAALPPSETDKLTSAGVNVVFKSMFTNEKQWFEYILEMMPHGGGLGVGWDWEGEKYGDERWLDTVLDADLDPVDFVVVDGSSGPFASGQQVGAARFFMQGVGLPGAIWCGNLEITLRGPGLYKAKAAAKAFANGSARNLFTAIFVAHFLGWSSQTKLLSSRLEVSEESARLAGGLLPTNGPTRTLDLTKEMRNLKIPVSLVSTVVSALPDGSSSLAAEKAIAQIFSRMRGEMKLVYIAFGSQGSPPAFGPATYKKIIAQASAVKNAVVFFVLPRNAPAEWLRRTGEEKDAGIPALPDNVVLSAWAPQREIFALTAESRIEVAFWTHGGVGSLSDAVAHTVPVACFPLADDQLLNCPTAVGLGLGVDLRPFAGDIGVPGLSREFGSVPSTPQQGSTITERLEYLFDNYDRYKYNIKDAREKWITSGLSQDALVDQFKRVVSSSHSCGREGGGTFKTCEKSLL